MRQVNAILRRNHYILRQSSPEGKSTLRRQVLDAAGFDFHYFTHVYRTRSGNTYYFCYDYGYMYLEGERVLVVSRHPFEKWSSGGL